MNILPTGLELRAKRMLAFDDLELRLAYFSTMANGKYYGVRPGIGMIQKLFIPGHEMETIRETCRSRFAELYEEGVDEQESIIRTVFREATKAHWESTHDGVNIEADDVVLHYQKLFEDTVMMSRRGLTERLDRS